MGMQSGCVASIIIGLAARVAGVYEGADELFFVSGVMVTVISVWGQWQVG
jgi:hypothetical protein